MTKRVLFIDRDGTLIVEPPVTQQVDSLELLEFLPGAITAMSTIAKSEGYELVLVTNQDGLGTASFPEETFWPAHNKMLRTLENEGVRFANVCIDRSFEYEQLPSRKPGTGMLTQYMTGDYDLANSFVIGDRTTDLQLARNLGCKAIYVGSDAPAGFTPELVTVSWSLVASFLVAQIRSASVVRETKETSVAIDLSLYGAGNIEVQTGLGFFDHMLHLLGAHAGFDLRIIARGDLHVDEHHLIEDVGLTLGMAIRQALGDLSGIQRYGFLLPMDEALAQVALDLSGRSNLEWSAQFSRERIGDVPTEMFKHFFKSLVDTLRCSLHISVTGENEHHKAEAIFKGVGRTLRSAVARDGRGAGVPSTKGVL